MDIISPETQIAIAPENYMGAIMPPNAAHKKLVLQGAAFATSWQVILYAAAGINAENLRGQIREILENIDFEMSPFRGDSFISRFNHAENGAVFNMPADFKNVVWGALEIARLADGAFDPCVWDAVQEWGFGFKQVTSAPDEYILKRLRAAPNWRALRTQGDEITKTTGMTLDFCAIAKGYAVDKVAALLAANCDISAALVEIGGELKGFGIKPDYQPWWVEIAAAKPALKIALNNIAIATSGDAYRGFSYEGKRLSHTINPAIGAPAETDIAWVSVIDKNCWRADALATALMVMGHSAALRFANNHAITCVLCRHDGQQSQSDIFTKWCE